MNTGIILGIGLGILIGLIICYSIFTFNKAIKRAIIEENLSSSLNNPVSKLSQEDSLDLSRYSYDIEEHYEGPSCPNPLDSTFFYRSHIYKDGKLIKTSKWYEENKESAKSFAKYFIKCEARKDLENSRLNP